MIALHLAFVASAAIGLLASALALRFVGGAARWALAGALALPVGIGATGLLFLAWRAVGGSSTALAALPELALLAALSALNWRAWRADRRGNGASRRPSAWFAAAIAVALVAAVVVFAAALARTRQAPSGAWDAWAMWNMKGRMIAWGADWLYTVVDPELPHADYPLLLSASVARLIALASAAGTWGPGALGVLWGSAGVLVTAGTLFALRGPRAALLGALLAAAAPGLVIQAALQYADIPVGTLFAAGLSLLAVARARDVRGAAILGGIALGMAAWTKNEGLVMLAVAAVAWVAVLAREGGVARLRRLALPFLAGALALVIPLLLARRAAPPADYALDGIGVSLAQVADPARWGLIADGLLKWGDPRGNPAPWLLLAASAVAGGWRGQPRGVGFMLVAVGLCFAADVAAYLTSPWALAWQLETSLARVLLQLWPAAVIGMIGLGDLDDAAHAAPRRLEGSREAESAES